MDAPAHPMSSSETSVGLWMILLIICSRFLFLSFFVVATYPFPPYLSSCREHPGLSLWEREQKCCQEDAPGEAAGTVQRGAGAPSQHVRLGEPPVQAEWVDFEVYKDRAFVSFW